MCHSQAKPSRRTSSRHVSPPCLRRRKHMPPSATGCLISRVREAHDLPSTQVLPRLVCIAFYSFCIFLCMGLPRPQDFLRLFITSIFNRTSLDCLRIITSIFFFNVSRRVCFYQILHLSMSIISNKALHMFIN